MDYRITPAGEEMLGTLRKARTPKQCCRCHAPITAGDGYYDCHSETPAYQSGHPYCLGCAIEFVWVEEVTP